MRPQMTPDFCVQPEAVETERAKLQQGAASDECRKGAGTIGKDRSFTFMVAIGDRLKQRPNVRHGNAPLKIFYLKSRREELRMMLRCDQ